MKSLFEQLGGIYREENEYFISNLALPAKKEKPMVFALSDTCGIFASTNDYFIQNWLTSGKLNVYLVNLNEQAEDMFFRLVTQMTKKQGITEELKADNQLEWIGRMNAIRNGNAEIVNHNLIYV